MSRKKKSHLNKKRTKKKEKNMSTGRVGSLPSKLKEKKKRRRVNV